MSTSDPLGANDQPAADRRRQGTTDDTPMATLARLPALTVLARLPVPAVAVIDDGTILFANEAMATMLGFTQDALHSMNFADIFQTPVEAQNAVAVIHERGGTLVALAHAEDSTVRAVMSRSALQRADEQIALVTFQDVTEQLWLEGR